MGMKDNEQRVYTVLKSVWEQNIKPHILYVILKTHEDGEFHRGKELVDRGYDLSAVYDGIEILVVKGDLTRDGKKTKITPKGLRVLKKVDEIAESVSEIIIE